MFYYVYMTSTNIDISKCVIKSDSGTNLREEYYLIENISPVKYTIIPKRKLNRLDKCIFKEKIVYEGIFEMSLVTLLMEAFYSDKIEELYETESFRGDEYDYSSIRKPDFTN